MYCQIYHHFLHVASCREMYFSVTRHKESTGHWFHHQISTRRSGVIFVRRDLTFRSVSGLPQPPTRFVSRVLFTGAEVAKAGSWPHTTPSTKVKNT
jgi:hypothetical protein